MSGGQTDLEWVALRFAHGECVPFAAACLIEHRREGWQAVGFWDEGDRLLHVACELPDGRFFDAYGYVGLQDIARRYGCEVDQITVGRLREYELIGLAPQDWRDRWDEAVREAQEAVFLLESRLMKESEQKMEDINDILRACPVKTTSGAPMGQQDLVGEFSRPLLLQRIEWVDGDYAPDGTYWGGGQPLWCAFNPQTDRWAPGMGTRLYVRADTPEQAVDRIRQRYPEAQIEPGSWHFSEAVQGYLEAARFTQAEEAGGADLEEVFVAQARADVARFLEQASAAGIDVAALPARDAGRDLWLNRNGHGSGFWDRPEIYGAAAQALSALAASLGSHEVLWRQPATESSAPGAKL